LNKNSEQRNSKTNNKPSRHSDSVGKQVKPNPVMSKVPTASKNQTKKGINAIQAIEVKPKLKKETPVRP
jgi:hypothetical protein